MEITTREPRYIRVLQLPPLKVASAATSLSDQKRMQEDTGTKSRSMSQPIGGSRRRKTIGLCGPLELSPLPRRRPELPLRRGTVTRSRHRDDVSEDSHFVPKPPVPKFSGGGDHRGRSPVSVIRLI